MAHQSQHRRGLLVVLAVFAFVVVSGTMLFSFQWIYKPFPGFFLHENLTVGPYFLPHWNGGAAGLQSLDRIVSVNGTPIGRRAEVYQRAHNAPVGTHLHYQVIRNSKTLDLTIPTMAFTLQDWFLSFGVYVLTGLAFFVIGVAPYCFRAASPAALPLSFMVTAVFVWFESTFDFMTDGIVPKEMRIFGMILTPSAGIHLAFLLKSGKPLRRSHPLILVFIYGMAALLGWLNSVTFFGPVDLWIYTFRAAYVFACLGALAFLGILGSALKNNVPELERSRLRVILVGAVLGFLIPTFATVLTSTFQWAIPYNLAMISTVFFPLSVAYALLKYSLFDLGNTLKAGLTRLLLMVFLLALYAGIFFLVGPSVGIYDKDPLTPLFFSVLVVLIFNPVLRGIERVVDRYIYRQEYDPVKVQSEISLFLRSLTTAAVLAEGFLKQVALRLGLENAVLIYRSQAAQSDLVAMTRGIEVDSTTLIDRARALWSMESIAGYRGISRDEIVTNPIFERQRQDWLVIFETLRSELLIPIVFEHEVRGLASFSAKRQGNEYRGDDLRLLGTLTDQLALSLENGIRYEQSEKSKDEYRRLYDEAEGAKRRLIEADRIKKDFVANVCHELRTPVSTIIGFGEILLDRDVPGDSREILQRMVNNGQDLSNLMDSLLDFSRIEADAVPNRFEHVNVKEIMGGLEVMTQRLIRGRPIEFRVNIESAIETIQSDPRKLQQILVQLLTNALKFTDKGEVEIKIRTFVDETGGFLEIAVADTGIGIDKKDQEVIFEGFRQLDGSSTRHYGGTGVGLGLCKKLAGALGGKITVNSEIGAGSVFSLFLPMTDNDQQLEAVQIEAMAV
ncbi:MAG: ATP-binding protein [Candidatus Binatia bacterium]